MLYRFVLGLHLIAVISWMAGILYLVRLFVYHVAETEAIVKSRFSVMETRLFRIITLPASIAALVFGGWMLWLNPLLLQMPWMVAKLLLALGLFGFTHWCGAEMRRIQAGRQRHSERAYRFLNEVPTLIMIAIIFLVMLRPF